MTIEGLLLIWVASVCLGVACGALVPRTRWWVGLLACVVFGPLGFLLIALDVATWRPGSTAVDL